MRRVRSQRLARAAHFAQRTRRAAICSGSPGSRSATAGRAVPESVIERLNKEIKCRTDVAGIFPHPAAFLRLAGSVLIEQHDE